MQKQASRLLAGLGLGVHLTLGAEVLWRAAPGAPDATQPLALSANCRLVDALRDGAAAIQIGPGTGATLRTPDVVVQQRRAYRFRFQAKILGTAANADVTSQRERLNSKHLDEAPWWRIHFLDAAGASLGESPAAHRRIARLGDDWREIVDEFHTPDRCARVSLSIGSASPENVLFVAAFSLEEIPPSNLLNLNPDFALGDTNYSGYHGETYLTQLETHPDGKVVLDMSSPGWIVGDRIPVAPLEKLRLSFSAVGTCPRASCCSRLRWHRPDGAAAGETENMWVQTGTDREMNATYTVPDGVTWAAIIVGNGTFRWVKLEKVE